MRRGLRGDEELGFRSFLIQSEPVRSLVNIVPSCEEFGFLDRVWTLMLSW